MAQNNLVAVQFESAPLVDSWTLSTSTPGFTEDGYFRWDGPNLFNSPGASGIFGFNFEVQQGGNYQLRLRNRHENPDATEENDVWIRMDGGPWVKTFSNMAGSVGAWTWESRFDFSHGNQPNANYDLSWSASASSSRPIVRFQDGSIPPVPAWRPRGPEQSTPGISRRFGEELLQRTPTPSGASPR